ncbi:MAG: peptidoglycan editing factor PgeF [Nitratireductor sp.]|nr:peptidoglycan editing factor PgeF [Nitratireductor sp.]
MSNDSPNPVIAPQLALSGIGHGFFTREGGVSTGLYRGLNTGIGSNDDPRHVMENRARVARYFGLPPQGLATLYQIHSPDAVILAGPIAGERPKADGMATATPGIVLGVQTADCGPVLFADADAGVVGACHAGWKGATGGVMESTVEAMEQLGATRAGIRAVLGPTISGRSYEVGPEFSERLIALDPGNTRWLAPSQNPGHAMFDLPGYIVNRLRSAGIEAASTGQCTYEDEARFFSYRRTTHRKEADYGRQISAICLTA